MFQYIFNFFLIKEIVVHETLNYVCPDTENTICDIYEKVQISLLPYSASKYDPTARLESL